MADELDTHAALLKLQELLSIQTELATAQAEANRLTAEELRVRAGEVENERRKIDLQAQGLAIEKERMRRAEARLQEVIQRYSQAENLLITTDDSYGETVQRVIETQREIRDAQRDNEKALIALLTKNIDDLTDARQVLRGRRLRETVQDELLQREENLADLELRAAKYGSLNVPTGLRNEIEAERQRIEELTTRLAGMK